MKANLRLCLALLLVLLQISPPASADRGVRGVPGSPEFGFGAIVYPDGPFLKEALAAAVDLGLDWISVPVSWAALQPGGAQALKVEGLDPVMQVAAQRGISVMLSLSDAPGWAKTTQGPDAELTAALAATLARRYPAIKAVEFFPGANTRKGWGSSASPPAYLAVLKVAHQQLSSLPAPVLVVAAGLQPLAGQAAAGDMDDLVFLKELYRLGAREFMPVVSVQLLELSGDPLRFPLATGPVVFRHYEDVRRVMMENHHQSGLIWVTRLSLPSGKIEAQDSLYLEPTTQANWMSQAYIQLRSQLYVGSAFLQSLNPEPEGSAALVPSLLRGAGEQHPFYQILLEMIGLNQSGSVMNKPGTPKDGYFAKKRP